MSHFPAGSPLIMAASFTAGCMLIHFAKRFADAVTVGLMLVGVLATIGIGANLADRSVPESHRAAVGSAEVGLPMN